jgi:hypothetical protein
MSNNEEANKGDQAGIANANDLKNRRDFLKFGGAGVAALALGGAASAANNTVTGGGAARVVQQSINLGTGDTAIMNYAYLLEQLEADFYTRIVANNFFPGATSEERQIFFDLYDHESIHREFFRLALGANAIPTLTFDFSLVDFNNRDSVLTNSQNFEDTGVAAYNGVGQAVQSVAVLEIAGKIVSVEARHAAAIRDLRIPRLTYFAPEASDFILDPIQVLSLVTPFIPRGVTINASGLPRLILA